MTLPHLSPLFLSAYYHALSNRKAKKPPKYLKKMKTTEITQQLIILCVSTDLYITTQGKGNVHVQKMECADVCKLQTEEGNCVLNSVKVNGKKK